MTVLSSLLDNSRMGQYLGAPPKKIDLINGPHFADRRIVLPYNDVETHFTARMPKTVQTSYVPAYKLSTNLTGKEAIQPYPLQFTVHGDPRHHVSFLNPEILEHIIPFICDKTLLKMLEVCGHWFVAIHQFLLRSWARPILQGFIDAYRDVLQFEKADISAQPLYIEDFAVRIDVLLFAKVLPSCRGKCLEIAYHHQVFNPGPSPPCEAPRAPSDRSSQGRHRSAYRIECKPRGKPRSVWVRKDITKFHGDEILVFGGPMVPEVCVYDRIEIPINLSNALGVLNPVTFQWYKPKFVTDKDVPPREYGQRCLLDEEAAQWYDHDSFIDLTSSEIKRYNFFEPQWKLKGTEYSGSGIVVARSRFTAEATGEVEQATPKLGLHIRVADQQSPIVVPLKRLGMEHDRFANQQMRLGDRVTLYVVEGGPEPP